MAVKIRLRRVGKVHVPYYRIVVTDSRTKRDGRFIEQIGKYHPKEDPSYIEVDSDRAQYWLGVGAQPSDPVKAILQKTGDWQRFKGEPAPEPLLQPKSRRNRDEAFNEALKEAGSQPKDDATTPKKRSAKKTASAAKESAAKESPAKESPAKESPAKEDVAEPKAEAESPAADAPATDAPAKDAPADEAPAADSDAAPASEAGDDASTS